MSGPGADISNSCQSPHRNMLTKSLILIQVEAKNCQKKAPKQYKGNQLFCAGLNIVFNIPILI